ncbi:unnamed protein product [Gadus morhua 'NCC']
MQRNSLMQCNTQYKSLLLLLQCAMQYNSLMQNSSLLLFLHITACCSIAVSCCNPGPAQRRDTLSNHGLRPLGTQSSASRKLVSKGPGDEGAVMSRMSQRINRTQMRWLGGLHAAPQRTMLPIKPSRFTEKAPVR